MRARGERNPKGRKRDQREKNNERFDTVIGISSME